MSHPLYWVALQQALGVPSRRLTALLDHFGSPEKVFEASKRELARVEGLTPKEQDAILAKPYQAARRIWDDCAKAGIGIFTPENPQYPDALRPLADRPCVLYVKGTLPDLNRLPAVSVVGTRKPTVYGTIVTRRVASVMAAAGVVIVSGGALGIDSAAHAAALEADGLTVAVLGCGLLSNYLRSNRALWQRIEDKGALISEYPLRTPAARYTFPVRNRLIAALSMGTVIIEAGEKSGSLITADCALEQGKEVFAVPGSVMSPHYKGSNRLIADGAVPVFTGLDVLDAVAARGRYDLQMHNAAHWQEKWNREELVWQEPEPATPPVPTPKPPVPQKILPADAGKDLSDTARLVYNMISDTGSAALDDLVRLTGLTSPAVSRELTGLELDGLIGRDPTGQYRIAGEEVPCRNS